MRTPSNWLLNCRVLGPSGSGLRVSDQEGTWDLKGPPENPLRAHTRTSTNLLPAYKVREGSNKPEPTSQLRFRDEACLPSARTTVQEGTQDH